MTTVLYLVVAGLAAIGLARTMRAQARGRRYLESSPDEGPLQLSHLSRRLQALVRDTRALRLAIEGGPLRELEESAGSEWLAEQLQDAARSLGSWLYELEHLPRSDRDYVADVGASPDRIRALFQAEGWSLEFRRQPGQPTLRDRLRMIVGELQHFEERMQTPPDPYR